VKAFRVEEYVMSLMVFLEQLSCLDCGFFGNARYMEFATSLQRQLHPRSGAHGSLNSCSERCELSRIWYCKAGIPPREGGPLAKVGEAMRVGVYERGIRDHTSEARVHGHHKISMTPTHGYSGMMPLIP